MYNLEDIAKQFGSANDATVFIEDEFHNIKNEKVTLNKTPVKLGKSCGLNVYAVWIKPVDNSADYTFVTFDESTKEITVPTEIVNLGTESVYVSYFTKKVA